MRGIIGKVHLIVRKKPPAPVDAEVRSCDQGQVIRVGGMKQGMVAGEARSLRCQVGQILIFAGDFVVYIFQNDNQHAIEMAGAGPGCGSRRFILLPLRRLG